MSSSQESNRRKNADPNLRKNTVSLLSNSGAEQAFDQALQVTVRTLLLNVPEAEARKKNLEDFINKIVGFKQSQEKIADIYEKYFTADEIQTINQFFSTAAGKKFIQNQKIIANEVGEYTQSIMMEHQEEIQKLLYGPKTKSKQK